MAHFKYVRELASLKIRTCVCVGWRHRLKNRIGNEGNVDCCYKKMIEIDDYLDYLLNLSVFSKTKMMLGTRCDI